jgi:hypothetical protein
MMSLRKSFLRFLLLTVLLLPLPAQAEVVVSFYSREMGTRFPHAFVLVKGSLDRGGLVDKNYGFTAKTVTPAILMGSVTGEVSSVSPEYLAKSEKQFSLKISDAQYDALMAHVAKWKALPGKSYNLNKRNCVHFVGEAARVVGLDVVIDPKLIKKPKSFLLSIVARNPRLKGS